MSKSKRRKVLITSAAVICVSPFAIPVSAGDLFRATGRRTANKCGIQVSPASSYSTGMQLAKASVLLAPRLPTIQASAGGSTLVRQPVEPEGSRIRVKQFYTSPPRNVVALGDVKIERMAAMLSDSGTLRVTGLASYSGGVEKYLQGANVEVIVRCYTGTEQLPPIVSSSVLLGEFQDVIWVPRDESIAVSISSSMVEWFHPLDRSTQCDWRPPVLPAVPTAVFEDPRSLFELVNVVELEVRHLKRP